MVASQEKQKIKYQNKINELNKLFLKASLLIIQYLILEWSMQGYLTIKSLYVQQIVLATSEMQLIFHQFKIANITIIGGEDSDDIATLLLSKNISFFNRFTDFQSLKIVQ